ncbi:MAG: M56 family metallopeptidase [Candidatus Omnitrophica bacterium]|nr:M56 family metallopeptidase [Candidatus Omnitrophota bacterium]
MNLLEHLNTPLAVQLIETFAHFLWQGVLILAVAELLGLLLKRASSHIRYALFLGSFLLMALAPVATFVWLNPDTPDFEVAPLTESVHPVAASIEPVMMTEETLPAVPATWRDYCPHLALLYLTGVFILICRVAFAFGGGWKLRQSSTLATDPIHLATLNDLTDRIRLVKAPALAYCKRVTTPTVVGILRPTILFPFFMMNGLTPNQVEMILLHELAHIKRYDPWVNLFQRLIEALLFFHPAVWWLSHRVRVERERCCDDYVVSMGAERFSYAKTLVEAAALRNESQLSPHPSGVHLTDGKNHLRSRILRLIEGPTPEKTNLPRAWILGAAVVLFFSVASWIQVGAEEDTPDKGNEEPFVVESCRVPNTYGNENSPRIFLSDCLEKSKWIVRMTRISPT